MHPNLRCRQHSPSERCHLFWESETFLYIACDDYIQICRVVSRESATMDKSGNKFTGRKGSSSFYKRPTMRQASVTSTHSAPSVSGVDWLRMEQGGGPMPSPRRGATRSVEVVVQFTTDYLVCVSGRCWWCAGKVACADAEWQGVLFGPKVGPQRGLEVAAGSWLVAGCLLPPRW